VPGWLKETENCEDAVRNAFKHSGFLMQEWKLEERVHKFRDVGHYVGKSGKLNSFPQLMLCITV